MKQAQLKTISMFILFCLLSAVAVMAVFSVTQNFPSNEWVRSNSVDFNFTPDMQVVSIPWCAIYVNDTGGAMLLKANYTDVVNGTPHVAGIAQNDTLGLIKRQWNVSCYNGSDQIMGSSINFGVDGTPPAVTLDSPATGSYLAHNNDSLLFTAVDSSNPGNCSMYTNVTGSWEINFSVNPFVSGTQYELNFTGSPDGLYFWNVLCNDIAGNSVWGDSSANRTTTIDTVNPTEVIIRAPVNNTGSSDTTPEVAWNETTDSNFEKYLVEVSTTFAMDNIIQTKEITSITSNVTNLSELETDNTYFIRVTSSDLAGRSAVSTTIVQYNLDSTVPNVTLITPQNLSYTSDNSVDFNVTLTDDNPSDCLLWLSEAGTSAVTKNGTVESVVSGTIVNITVPGMIDGDYRFNIGCNDTVGNIVNVSISDLNVTIDTVNPTEPNISSTWGGTNSTDLTPLLTWVASTDTNFAYYIAIAQYESNDTIADTQNVTTTFVNMNLSILNTYNFTVTAVDLARNSKKSVNTTEETRYYVDNICGTLFSGWNLCGAVWTSAKNLSRIGAETSANMVSIWNTTNHVWATCNFQSSPSGANCEMDTMIGGGEDDANATHVWIYVNSSRNWRNRTWQSTAASGDITLRTNVSQGWNIIPGQFRNGRNFRTLGNLFNQTNVTMFSLPYNVNGTSRPYVNKGLFATSSMFNATVLDYGRAMWVFYNNTVGNTTFSVGSW